MSTTHTPSTSTLPDGAAVSILQDSDPVNMDDLYREASPGGTKKLTLALLADWATSLWNSYAPKASPALTGTATAVNLTVSGTLKRNATVNWSRYAWKIAGTTDITSSGVPDAVNLLGTAFTGYPTIRTVATTGSTCKTVVHLDNLPQGGTLTSMSVTSTGITINGTLTVATYTIASMDPTTGTTTALSSAVNDDHTSGNWGTTRTTTVTPTSPIVINNANMYVLIVTHPHSVSAGGANFEINQIGISGTADTFSPA